MVAMAAARGLQTSDTSARLGPQHAMASVMQMLQASAVADTHAGPFSDDLSRRTLAACAGRSRCAPAFSKRRDRELPTVHLERCARELEVRPLGALWIYGRVHNEVAIRRETDDVL
jgi:hypothetical protein